MKQWSLFLTPKFWLRFYKNRSAPGALVSATGACFVARLFPVTSLPDYPVEDYPVEFSSVFDTTSDRLVRPSQPFYLPLAWWFDLASRATVGRGIPAPIWMNMGIGSKAR